MQAFPHPSCNSHVENSFVGASLKLQILTLISVLWIWAAVGLFFYLFNAFIMPLFFLLAFFFCMYFLFLQAFLHLEIPWSSLKMSFITISRSTGTSTLLLCDSVSSDLFKDRLWFFFVTIEDVIHHRKSVYRHFDTAPLWQFPEWLV